MLLCIVTLTSSYKVLPTQQKDDTLFAGKKTCLTSSAKLPCVYHIPVELCTHLHTKHKPETQYQHSFEYVLCTFVRLWDFFECSYLFRSCLQCLCLRLRWTQNPSKPTNRWACSEVASLATCDLPHLATAKSLLHCTVLVHLGLSPAQPLAQSRVSESVHWFGARSVQIDTKDSWFDVPHLRSTHPRAWAEEPIIYI